MRKPAAPFRQASRSGYVTHLLTDQTAMATLRARLSGSFMLLIGLLLLVTTLTTSEPGNRTAATLIVAPIPFVAVAVLIAGPRLGDLMFVLSQCLVEIVLVPLAYLAESPHTSHPGDNGFFVPVMMSAVFAGRRRDVALQVAVTIASASLTTLHLMGRAQLQNVIPAEVFAFIASAVVIRVLRELAQEGMQQAQTAVRQAEAATRRAEVGEITDPLTGLLNRRGFERTASSEWSRRADEHLPLAVLLIDIDHFKKVNDTLGHAAGDAMLLDVATRLTDLLRDGDRAYRLGGEEFVLLARCRSGEAAVIAERVRAEVEQHLPVTVSIGVLEAVPQSATDVVATLWRAVDSADQGLYDAKRAGRNRVVTVAAS